MSAVSKKLVVLGLVFMWAMLVNIPSRAWELTRCVAKCNSSHEQCIKGKTVELQTECESKRDMCISHDDTSCISLIKTKRRPGEPRKASKLFASAVEQHNYQVMDLLLKQGADINCLNCGLYAPGGNPSGRTPLMSAVQNWLHLDSTRLANYLLDRGADVNYQSVDGVSALMEAARAVTSSLNSGDVSDDRSALYKQYIATMGRMLKLGAHANTQDNQGQTALFYLVGNLIVEFQTASKKQFLYDDIFDLLISSGADIDHMDFDGNTALTLAVKGCRIGTTKMLLARGAKRELKNYQGNSAITIAIEVAAERGDKCNELISLLSDETNRLVKPGNFVGVFSGYAASSLNPGEHIPYVAEIKSDGTFVYQAVQGATTILSGEILSQSDSTLVGKGLTILPRDQSGRQLYYEPGVDKAQITFNATRMGDVVKGVYSSKYESGRFVMCPNQVLSGQSCIAAFDAFRGGQHVVNDSNDSILDVFQTLNKTLRDLSR